MSNKPCELVMEWVKRINSGERADEVIPYTLPMGLTTAGGEYSESRTEACSK